MSTHTIVVENRKDWEPNFPAANIVEVKEYLANPEYLKSKQEKVINLCRSYRYLSLGYYCSLLAEARWHRVIPSVKTISDLSSKSVYSLNLEDLGPLVEKSFRRHNDQPPGSTFLFHVFFGRCEFPNLQEVARQIFDQFPCPLLKVELKRRETWQIDFVKPVTLNNLTPEQHPFFIETLNSHLGSRWREPRASKMSRCDIAILVNPGEKLPPSNAKALQNFIRIGKKLNVDVDLIEKKDYPRLAEYDALFIRETTQVDHYTYRFSKKAESEGMAVIDDPDSILKCSNKVFLAELMKAHNIPTPRTLILRKGKTSILEGEMSYPCVIKIPDGSFSRGVFKAETFKEAAEIAERLFKESDLILAQEFLYTEFDWRIGVLNRKPLFACQYFMPGQHWQIVKHEATGRVTEGAYKSWRIEDVPPLVVNTALKAANAIGNGFYGVDIKQRGDAVYVIEVNDNPNFDSGVEDAILGDALYQVIIEELVRRVELPMGA
jgi:glutathione synthase/RimK-type ligase-like ATP-grasp enzyme